MVLVMTFDAPITAGDFDILVHVAPADKDVDEYKV
jgi:hypothetical protein